MTNDIVIDRSNLNLRNPKFDVYFIFLIPMLGISLAILAQFYRTLYPYILTFDILFLSNHHVIATYLRITFDKKGFSENKTLLFVSPFLLAAAVMLILIAGYSWILFTIFIHWQWFHYGKQSEGINKSFSIKLKSQESGSPKFRKFIFFMTPVVTYLIMNSRSQRIFLNNKVYLLPVPETLATYLGIGASLLFLYWLVLQIEALKNGKLAPKHFCYILSHHVIYLFGYVAIKDITIGWIALSTWHNLQYISYVWHFNTNKFNQNPHSYNKFLGVIGNSKNVILYLIAGFLFSFLFYKGIVLASNFWVIPDGPPLFFIANQIIIYHHYVADALLWKLRKTEVISNL